MTTGRTVARASFVFAVIAFLLIGEERADATTFRPTFSTVLSTNAVGAHPDTTTTFDVPAPHSLPSSVVGYTDGAFDIAGDAAVPSGAIVGNASFTVTFGINNGFCGSFPFAGSLPQLKEADTSITDIIVPSGAPANKLQNLIQDNRGANPGDPPNGLPDYVDATPSYNNTVFTPAGGGTPLQPRARYADHTEFFGITVVLQAIIFDPGDLLDLANGDRALASLGFPAAVLIGDPTGVPFNSAITDACTPISTTTTLLGVTEDNGCTPHPAPPPCGGTTPPSPGPIGTDNSCAGSGEGGCYRLTNPLVPTTVQSTLQTASLRDADDDGIENQLDPCALSDSGAWDPRSPSNPTTDADGDGIDSSCDPTPNTDTNSGDHDDDKWLNRLDNCPTVFNGDATISSSVLAGVTTIPVNDTGGFYIGDRVRVDPNDTANVEERVVSAIDPPPAPTSLTFSAATSRPHAAGDTIVNLYVAADGVTPRPNEGQNDEDLPPAAAVPDGGPHSDGIGPECDPNPTSPNGHYHGAALIFRNCVGSAANDGDGDGVCAAGAAQLTDPNDSSSDSDGDGVADREDNCMSVANPPPAGLPQADGDRDGIGDACEGLDFDGDGFANSIETHVDTHPYIPCSADGTADNENPDALPTDLNDDRAVTGADLSQIAAVIGQTVPPGAVRRDIAPDPFGDDAITGADLSRIAAVIGSSC